MEAFAAPDSSQNLTPSPSFRYPHALSPVAPSVGTGLGPGTTSRQQSSVSTDCVSARSSVCENFNYIPMIVTTNGSQTGFRKVYTGLRGNLDNHSSTYGLTFIWESVTQSGVIPAAAKIVQFTLTQKGRSGMPDQALQTINVDTSKTGTYGYTFNVNPSQLAGSAGQYYETHVKFYWPGGNQNTTVEYDSSYTQIRCDNAVEVNYGSGCVNVDWRPTLDFAQANYPKVAENITLGQAATGLGIKDQTPLTRTTPLQALNNRNFTCSEARKAAMIGPKPYEGAECDEYPFASTAEGGTENTRIMWVPGVEENRAQGQDLLGYYRSLRIMAGDPYYVRII
ncbi:NucA/NucB deoxyribonuclease domain-containing protein [Gordonia sp. N1V]|uniref:NucA/NucB deoxyribonuclease domain-containing protein n=1 Tax=Gordonia sp. N1V TaxID=3034163 RepID=UPI0023E2E00C|nr:NucA/NucB deoxyribonuclease domain-containing protein [Gordonia sp. N1V]MDF3285002.1 NucA/NucB deoxyribonuclease domain-containing protein [Gordonia sp. N1V]